MIKNYPLELIRKNRYQARQFEDAVYLRDLAAGVGVKLPKGWNEPPIQHTDHNCWHCGRFGSNPDHLLQAELEDGWGCEFQGEKHLDVFCPGCGKKPRKVDPVKAKPAAKPTKKAKHKK
jgi:hypothetical protein